MYVLTVPPYRRYYLYLCPEKEKGDILPQLASVYAIMYFLGTITRYRPQEFERMLRGALGAYILEFLASQPSQFLYLAASDFAQREITLPAIV
jgi:hypothetical protein